MRLDWEELRQIRSEGFLAIVPHPEPAAGLTLLNYTARAQFQAAWDRYPTLLDCRGTIVNDAGEVVVKPFRKFFNVGERPETAPDRLAMLGTPEVAHKLDGSMCVLYPFRDGHRLATRGSFVSDQAVRATALWQERHAGSLNGALDPRLTYIFELVGPGNRIIVRYDREDLILIGLTETTTGRELSYCDVGREAGRLGLPHVALEPTPEDGWDEWQGLMAREGANFEGFVLFWPAHSLRVKIKLAEYVRLHRLISGLSEHLLWEYLRDGRPLEPLRAAIPEETLPWLDATVADFARAHTDLAAGVAAGVARIRAAGLDPANRADRKEVARLVIQEGDRLRPAIFRALDGKEYASLLWRMLEPTGAEPIHALDEG